MGIGCGYYLGLWTGDESVSYTHLDVYKRQLPFVAAVRKVWTAPDSIPARNADRKKEVTNKVTKSNNYYGDAWWQIAVHHGESLHAAGFRGKGDVYKRQISYCNK